jgi:probable selenium-dependent hydroxylase accessory protein YqeC
MVDPVHDFALAPGERIAAIGAGGTTRLLGRMAVDWASAGGRPWIATTTRLDDRELPGAARVIRLPGEPAERLALVSSHPLRGRLGEVIAAGTSSGPSGPLGALSEEEIARLAERWEADLVLVKADGTRGQPFKAHAEHEPAIPAYADLVVAVAGLWALGEPLGEDIVHRAARAAELWGYALGEPVDEALVRRALCEPEGYRRRVPPRARYAVFLNHRGEPELVAAAARIAADLREAGVLCSSGDLGGGRRRR